MNVAEQVKMKVSHSISFKLAVIFLLVLIIQLPLSYVRDLIYERQSLQQQAKNEIAKRWGGHQYIGAPMVSIEAVREKRVANDKLNHVSVKEHYHKIFQTKKMQADIELDAEKRYLGIYEAVVFQSKMVLSGSIEIDQPSDIGNGDWSLFVPIRQLRGVKKVEKIILNGQRMTEEPVQKTLNNMSGFDIGLNDFKGNNSVEYEIELALAGSEIFEIVPMARETVVNMQSNWASPSFIGDYLPDERSISDVGFTAQWRVNRMLKDVQDHDQLLNNGQYSYTHNTQVNNNTWLCTRVLFHNLDSQYLRMRSTTLYL